MRPDGTEPLLKRYDSLIDYLVDQLVREAIEGAEAMSAPAGENARASVGETRNGTAAPKGS